jgi:rhodanese-related sulfurtransferase
LTAELPARPAYFADEVARNRTGAAPLEELPPLRSLSAAEVREMQAAGAVVLDTRPVIEFAVAHVPGSIHIALNGQFASWAARMFGSGEMGVDVPVLLLADDDAALSETRLRLSRVGIDHAIGALEGGIHSWLRAGFETSYIAQIAPVELAEWLAQPPEKTVVVDVREPGEHAAGAIPGAISIPLGQLRSRMQEIPRDAMVFVHCKGGYRSSIGSSVLQGSGFPRVANVTGGHDAWKLTLGS